MNHVGAWAMAIGLCINEINLVYIIIPLLESDANPRGRGGGELCGRIAPIIHILYLEKKGY